MCLFLISITFLFWLLIVKGPTGEVVPPQGPDFVLPPYVPHVELHVLVRYRFNVEANGGNRGDILVQL